MSILSPTKYVATKWVSGLLAAASVAACTTTVGTGGGTGGGTGFDAGGQSSHTPENYETIDNTTATAPSNLGGSTIKVELGDFGSLAGISVGTVVGTVTHDTGRIELDDGTFLFVDVDGPDVYGDVDNGSGAIGGVGQDFYNTYQYVTSYYLDYQVGTTSSTSFGVAGMITAPADMPSGGSATYTGEVMASVNSLGGTTGYSYEDGTSNVAVDFGSGTANVTLGSFSGIWDDSGALVTTSAPFDTIQGNGLVINGAHFSGGNWVTVENGVVVNVTGANSTAISSGTFFGYDSSISAPDEVGGVFVITGDDAIVGGIYIGD